MYATTRGRNGLFEGEELGVHVCAVPLLDYVVGSAFGGVAVDGVLCCACGGVDGVLGEAAGFTGWCCGCCCGWAGRVGGCGGLFVNEVFLGSDLGAGGPSC